MALNRPLKDFRLQGPFAVVNALSTGARVASHATASTLYSVPKDRLMASLAGFVAAGGNRK